MPILHAALVTIGMLVGSSENQRAQINLPGGGMSPCFPQHTRPAVTYTPYQSPSDVRRGDIILFRTEIQGKATDVVWRVLGLPSERIVFDQTRVSVNGRALASIASGNTHEWSYFLESTDNDVHYCVSYHRGTEPARRKRFEMTVPKDQFVVLGDNRDKSYDSRYIGAVPFERIIAKFDSPSCSCPKSDDDGSNPPLEPTPKDGAAQRPR